MFGSVLFRYTAKDIASQPRTTVVDFSREQLSPMTNNKRSTLTEIQSMCKEYNHFEYIGFHSDHDPMFRKDFTESNEAMDIRMKGFLEWIFEQKEEIINYSGHCDAIKSMLRIFGLDVVRPDNGSCVPFIVCYESC